MKVTTRPDQNNFTLDTVALKNIPAIQRLFLDGMNSHIYENTDHSASTNDLIAHVFVMVWSLFSCRITCEYIEVYMYDVKNPVVDRNPSTKFKQTLL